MNFQDTGWRFNRWNVSNPAMVLRHYVQRTPGTIRLRWIWIDKTDKLSQMDHTKRYPPWLSTSLPLWLMQTRAQISHSCQCPPVQTEAAISGDVFLDFPIEELLFLRVDGQVVKQKRSRSCCLWEIINMVDIFFTNDGSLSLWHWCYFIHIILYVELNNLTTAAV